jgi:hypothetical protein
VIVAVPEQRTVLFSGIGIPEHTAVSTWYRWWCSTCRVSAPSYCSHASLALDQAQWHLETVQCHVEGQMSLIVPTPQDWGFPGTKSVDS